VSPKNKPEAKGAAEGVRSGYGQMARVDKPGHL
jgi:hypothetical protein